MGVSDRVETYPKRVLGFGEILRVIVFDSAYVRMNILMRVLLRRHRFNTPRYLYINYKLLIVLCFVMLRLEILFIDLKMLIFIAVQI